MNKPKDPLQMEEFAKQIFKGAELKIRGDNEGNVLFYDFKAFYPEQLGVFIPSDLDHEVGYQKSFDDYFSCRIYNDVEYFARVLDAPLRNDLPDHPFECIAGAPVKLLPWFPVQDVFRFDECMPEWKRTHLLCRMKVRDMQVNDKLYIENVYVSPNCEEYVTGADGDKYLYWVMRVSDFFYDHDSVLAAALAHF